MEQSSDAEQQLLQVRHSLHLVVLEQRATTDELRAVTRELAALLSEMAGHDVFHAVVENVEPAPAPLPLHEGDRAAAYYSPAHIERELETAMLQNREALAESRSVRFKARQLRTTLQSQVKTRVRFAVNLTDAPLKDGHNLSKREREVLNLMVEGKSSKEIAAALGISFKTAVTHRASIMAKLDVHEIASVVREAILRGLV
ncbi:MAG TPA: LuxR C-terminal-related transcriptional regulator [Candidatus Sulfopaludibacter sp.]|jgi:DNA-binding CsgD family transcriptional regulator|nr:LuxR C-terminal-related transcriptional regulator [Candidatus Sulfopaludibacter sp.]